MNLNIPEILVANGTGIGMLLFLMIFRIRRQQFIQMHERVFSATLVAILIALVTETISFLVDGKIFFGSYCIQYLANFLCVNMSALVGFFWCMFVDYRIYCSTKRLQKRVLFLLIPTIINFVLLVGDLFGAGWMFSVDAGNCYHRGSLGFMTYLILGFYFVESIINVHMARKRGRVPFFFPVYCFVLPSMIGVVVQGFFYGLATAWLMTSLAGVFLYLELQTANSYMDDLSGLFNRQYMNYYLSGMTQRRGGQYGILLDVNDFKSINDCYGHTAGDRAIRTVGRLISASMLPNATAVRMGGDEFIVFLSDSNDVECGTQMRLIRESFERFLSNAEEPFELTVSMGSAKFEGMTEEEFLTRMDKTMYEVKREYHSANR